MYNFVFVYAQIPIPETKRYGARRQKNYRLWENAELVFGATRWIILISSRSRSFSYFFGEAVFLLGGAVDEIQGVEHAQGKGCPAIYISIKFAVLTHLNANRASWLSPVTMITSSPTDVCQALHVKEEKYTSKQCKIMDIPEENSAVHRWSLPQFI